MQRRDFLKFSGLLSAALFLQLIPQEKMILHPVEAQVGDKHYRGTSDGDIYESSDTGRTWQLHTRLGHQYSIMDLIVDSSKRVYARVGYLGHSFPLTLSTNGTHWNTL